MLVWMMIYYRLTQLFRLYAKEILFELENIRCIKSIGVYLMLNVLIGFICQPLMSLTLTFNQPPGQRFMNFDFSTNDFIIIMVGVMILVVSLIMQEARRIKKDKELTI
jgi:hypothetical protein